MVSTSRSLSLLATLTLSGPLVAQVVTPLVLEGDDVPGVGQALFFDDTSMVHENLWYVEVFTDHPDLDANEVLLGPEGVVLREGDSLLEPAGATIKGFQTYWINRFGDVGQEIRFDAGQGISTGVYTEFGTLVIRAGDVSNAASLTPGTTYTGFTSVKYEGNRILVGASVDDPNLPPNVDFLLMELELTTTGTLAFERVVAKSGDLLPGQSEPISGVGIASQQCGYDGEPLIAALLAGDPFQDEVLYLGDTLLAQKGFPSPVAGRNWSRLTPFNVSTRGGHHAYWGVMAGNTATNELIVLDGEKLVQERDSLPDIAPFKLVSFGFGPLPLSRNGDVLWYGSWNDSSQNAGLFLNDRLIVQAGVTPAAGSIISTIAVTTDGYALSPDGQHVMFLGGLQDGRSGAFLVDLGLGTNYCVPAPGAQLDVPATISASGSTHIGSGELTLFAGPVPIQPGIFFSGTSAIQVPFGNGFRCVGGNVTRFDVIFPFFGLAQDTIDLSTSGLPVGTSYFQYWYRDLGGVTTFNLSDGLVLDLVP